jgi:hypothetical protein
MAGGFSTWCQIFQVGQMFCRDGAVVGHNYSSGADMLHLRSIFVFWILKQWLILWTNYLRLTWKQNSSYMGCALSSNILKHVYCTGSKHSCASTCLSLKFWSNQWFHVSSTWSVFCIPTKSQVLHLMDKMFSSPSNRCSAYTQWSWCLLYPFDGISLLTGYVLDNFLF